MPPAGEGVGLAGVVSSGAILSGWPVSLLADISVVSPMLPVPFFPPPSFISSNCYCVISCRALASICAAADATLRSCDEGSGAFAARRTVCALRIVISGSPETAEESICTSPPTAYCRLSGPRWYS